MKTCLFLCLVLVVGLTAAPLSVLADEFDDAYTCYTPVGDPRAIVPPTDDANFNCILAENDGGYVTVWDDTTSALAILEHQSATNTQTWRHDLALADGESTRVVFGSANRVLWCSAQRWVFLDRDNGQTVSTGTWDQPFLAAEKVIIRDDIIHVIKEEPASLFDTNILAGSDEDTRLLVAYRFDTNMTALGTVTVAAPQGMWASYAGSWLLDLSNRNSHNIRVMSIATGVQNEFPLPTDLEDGFTEHRVLSADANRMFVLSSIHWPTTSLHYFTLFDESGIIFQKRMCSLESFTGVTSLADGWLISARSLGETIPRHYLFRVDPSGFVHTQLRISQAAPQNYIVLNTTPPRVLHVIDATHMEIIDVCSDFPWYWWWNGWDFFWPSVETLQDSSINAPVGATNNFWMTPICTNTK
jgi:hypothetical protein